MGEKPTEQESDRLTEGGASETGRAKGRSEEDEDSQKGGAQGGTAEEFCFQRRKRQRIIAVQEQAFQFVSVLFTLLFSILNLL